MITTNARRGVMRYFQIDTVLAQALAEASIAAGESLPSESALVRTYGVSRTTVRRALARLTAEGRIGCRRGQHQFRTRQAQTARIGAAARAHTR
jgi:DNA-binding GntR family transcriptional regulator